MPFDPFITFSQHTEILIGDCLEVLPTLPSGHFDTCITSPPYWQMRDYLNGSQIGQEENASLYVQKMVDVFSLVRRVLRDDGILWINLGDKYHDGNRMMIPARVALALQADGWILRDEIVWSKTRTVPSSLKNRCNPSHEMIYMFSKQKKYHFDYLAIEVPTMTGGTIRKVRPAVQKYGGDDTPNYLGTKDRDIVVRPTKRKTSVWAVAPAQSKSGHFAQFPTALIEPCVLAGSRLGGRVLDPFGGAGTTAVVAEAHGRECTLIELNPDYAEIARQRLGY